METKIRLLPLREAQTIAFKEEMQEAFLTGQSSESHHACMNGRVAKDEDEVKWGRME